MVEAQEADVDFDHLESTRRRDCERRCPASLAPSTGCTFPSPYPPRAAHESMAARSCYIPGPMHIDLMPVERAVTCSASLRQGGGQ